MSTVRTGVLERVRDALAALESAGDTVDTGVHTAALLQATREALEGLDAGDPAQRIAYRSLLHRVLDAAARRRLRLAFHHSPFAEEWTDLLLEAVLRADYTVGHLFLGRARTMGDRTLFLLPRSRREGRISWAEAESRVLQLARALVGFRRTHPEGPIALLGPNSPEMALLDLACLLAGVRNVPVPANSTAGGIEFILRHSGACALFVDGEELSRAAEDAAARVGIEPFYWLRPDRPGRGALAPFRDFLEYGARVEEEDLRKAVAAVRSGDIATVMYTSGTTGDPKGVPFSQGNLVTKRFARAAAWPDLGEGDVFLCYLPLYHTFGRWLEMLGCVFWGSVYAFVEDASIGSLLFSFQRVRPTTFISVPRKWLQIAESVAPVSEEEQDLDPAEDARITAALAAATGGRLRRGLSAAGYLPATVFRRFHAAGIGLHSGFGMTEATGGITMTPADDYRDDSIGVALPGISLKIASDGELLIRGCYVTPPGREDPPRDDGWFATGDIVTADAAGHIRIIDRKKEIFKNVQGETISPRRIETLFADFDQVERVIVLGDRREFCTVLIVPSEELRVSHAADRRGDVLESPALRDQFSGLVESVNRFLAPYERLLDFALLAEDLDAATELTAKGTPKRRVVTERLADAIEEMYASDEVTLEAGGVACRIPQWFLRYTGIPSREIRAEGNALVAPGRRLPVERLRGAVVRVGDAEYDIGGTELQLGEIFARAKLWLGNEAVRAFAGRGVEYWWRRGRRFAARTRLHARRPDASAPAFPPVGTTGDLTVAELHATARSLAHPEETVRRSAVQRLREALDPHDQALETPVRDVLLSTLGDPSIRADALRAVTPSLPPGVLEDLMAERIRSDPSFLDAREAALLGRIPLRGDQLERLVARAEAWAGRAATGGAPAPLPDALDRLLGLLLRVAVEHPASHLAVRTLLVTLAARKLSAPLSAIVEGHLAALVPEFRKRLSPPHLAAGVTWEDAVVFRGVEGEGAGRIRRAIAETELLAEAMILLSPGPPPELEDLVRGAVRVTFLGTGTGRGVHLLEWAPEGLDRGSPRFECILKLNTSLDWESIQHEVRLLVRTRSGESGRPVVKTQGGTYGEPGVWTEEFIPGRTLDELLEILAREDGLARVKDLWPFLISSCAALIVDFWRRTGCESTLSDPAPNKLILPEHDWLLGGRLVSVAKRSPCRELTPVLRSIRKGIVAPLAARFPDAGLKASWPLLFSAALEVLGEEEGCRRLEEEARAMDPTDKTWSAIRRFVSGVRRRGFLPLRLRVAARRYRRWAQLNADATLEARATTLDQIEDAYGLRDLDRERPGSRLQLFRHTVFRGSGRELAGGMDDLIAEILADPPPRAQLHRAVTRLRESADPDEHEEFFLARMLYPHVDPRGRAVLVRQEDTAGGFDTGIAVEQEDSSGEPFRIRRPVNPGEIGALARIFRVAGIRRTPRLGQDDLLIVTDERERIVGGIISHRLSETYVRLDWLALSRHRRGRGIGSRLVREFLARMQAEGVRVVSTGFFRPGFFANFGFGVDPRYAGLVRFLEPEPGEAPTAFKGAPGGADPQE